MGAGVLVILGMVIFGGGCKEQPLNEKGKLEKGFREKILVSGSGTLVPLFEKFKEAFEKERPEYFVKILLGTNTAGGIKGVKEKIIDMGLCSRSFSPEENKLGLQYVLLARDEIIFAVNHGVKGLPELTPQQIQDIYQGKITNWKQLGGNDVPVLVLDRDENEAIKMTLRDEIFGHDLKIDKDAMVLMHSADMDKVMVSAPGAIGYTGKGEGMVQRLLIKPIAIKGFKASPQNIRAGKYKLFLEIAICVSPEMNAKTKVFFDFITGPKGQAIMEQYQYVPMGKSYAQ